MNCLSLTEEIPSKYIAKIGISIEPVELVEQQSLDLQSKSLNNPSVSAEFGKKMLLNFFEYVSSFAIQSSEIADKASSSYIPFNALENWYRNFERKLTLNPNFWKSSWSLHLFIKTFLLWYFLLRRETVRHFVASNEKEWKLCFRVNLFWLSKVDILC